ncbi:MAG TPA: prevent-host-death protein [Spirochaetota bacterium]|nr:prevent-host-death protein [Spirochaetota bacterium]
MITASKSQLKSKMLEYFRRIEQSGEELFMTDNRKPVLRVTPLNRKANPAVVFDDFLGSVVHHEDIMADVLDELEPRTSR